MDDKKPPKRDRPSKPESAQARRRKERAAEALKQNLLKRKAQTRARSRDAAKEP